MKQADDGEGAKYEGVWNVRSYQQESCDPTHVQPYGGGGDVQTQKRRGANNEPV